nr:unnamed protein product [Callosobruchus analis]
MAICVLHNFLKKRASAYVGGNAFDSVNATTHEINYNAEWRENGVQLVGLRPVRQGTYSEAKQIATNMLLTSMRKVQCHGKKTCSSLQLVRLPVEK